MRECEIKRKTNETDIELYLNLDGTGKREISTGSGFFDHMLELFAAGSLFDLKVKCTGDTAVDFHHSAEDIGIALGTAFNQALGDKKGIRRYGDIILPMDETLILCALDISGRAKLVFDVDFNAKKVGSFDTELCEEFFEAFVRNAKITLHLKKLAGKNTHHLIEGVFKSFARALRKAVETDERIAGEIPSSKGIL
ncbi:MAG: imidazoleglycerol-phosphate dehydratase HisB [Clostridiales bacterium]|nr:imidazoleglycerol-phosphate dehydratase HisB [Clostridiales bacterium]